MRKSVSLPNSVNRPPVRPASRILKVFDADYRCPQPIQQANAININTAPGTESLTFESFAIPGDGWNRNFQFLQRAIVLASRVTRHGNLPNIHDVERGKTCTLRRVSPRPLRSD